MKHSFLFFLIFLFIIYYVLTKFINTAPIINEKTKICLVTGASSGIGEQISKCMIKKGWKVLGISRNFEKLQDIQKEVGSNNFITYKCDISDFEQIKKVSQEIKTNNLKPTLFFLNAGTGDIEAKNKISVDSHKKTFDTNYFGTIGFVQEWVDSLKELGGGTFVATSSVMSFYALPESAAYSASKAAINMCFQSLRLKYIDDNIGFVIALPGPVDTSILKNGEKLPFKQTAEKCAQYIVNQTFNRSNQIEPSWFYSAVVRLLNWIPDKWVLKIVK
ncbi:MAG: SDR family oxidoreductase [Candidatus Babeliales bacterium]